MILNENLPQHHSYLDAKVLVVPQISKISYFLSVYCSAFPGGSEFVSVPPLNHDLSSDPMRRVCIP